MENYILSQHTAWHICVLPQLTSFYELLTQRFSQGYAAATGIIIIMVKIVLLMVAISAVAYIIAVKAT